MELSPLRIALLIAVAALSVVAALHALLHKRDPRAALGWVVVCLAYPVAGPLAYALFGVNRIRTKGRKIRAQWVFSETGELERAGIAPADLRASPIHTRALAEIARVSEHVGRRRLVGGNRVEPLWDGEEAYPPMLEAIEGAQHSIWLCTYIFETNTWGRRFIDALADACDRGVQVRVLLDGVGQFYSWPTASKLLRKRGVEVAHFLPPSPRHLHINLRNHRKLLVIDRRLGFTGGMNLGDRHLARGEHARRGHRDLHFRVRGPVVAQIEEAFFEDWSFATGRAEVPPDSCTIEPAGETFCRGISDGPNEDYERLLWILVGAINAARRRVRILSPYFLPDKELQSALCSAAQRGVEVVILLPGRSNLPPVGWAMRAMLPVILEHGVQVMFQPPPFDHSKLLLVDDHYCLLGSANLDPRSLRLNFEYNLEAYGTEPAASLHRHFDQRQRAARAATRDELLNQPLWRKVRDSSFKLFQPYL